MHFRKEFLRTFPVLRSQAPCGSGFTALAQWASETAQELQVLNSLFLLKVNVPAAEQVLSMSHWGWNLQPDIASLSTKTNNGNNSESKADEGTSLSRLKKQRQAYGIKSTQKGGHNLCWRNPWTANHWQVRYIRRKHHWRCAYRRSKSTGYLAVDTTTGTMPD